jgi:hypothetical protein
VPRLAPLPRFASESSDGSVPTEPWRPDPPTLSKAPSSAWAPAAFPLAPPQSAIPTIRAPRPPSITPAKRAAILGFAAGILGGALAMATMRIAHHGDGGAEPSAATPTVVASPAGTAARAKPAVRADDLPPAVLRVEDLPVARRARARAR